VGAALLFSENGWPERVPAVVGVAGGLGTGSAAVKLPSRIKLKL
jgi:hypothetical protein